MDKKLFVSACPPPILVLLIPIFGNLSRILVFKWMIPMMLNRPGDMGVVLTERPVYTKFTITFDIEGGALPEIDTEPWYTHSLKWEKTDALAFTDNNSGGLFFI